MNGFRVQDLTNPIENKNLDSETISILIINLRQKVKNRCDIMGNGLS